MLSDIIEAWSTVPLAIWLVMAVVIGGSTAEWLYWRHRAKKLRSNDE